MPAGALRSAVNVLIDTSGAVETAPGFQQTHAETGMHSLWSDAGEALCVSGSQLCRVSSGVPTPIAALEGADPVSYCRLNEKVIISSRLQIAALEGEDSLYPLAIPTPSFAVGPAAAGGLNAGRYGVAVSLRRGEEESGLSSMIMVDVPQGGGLSLDLPAGGDAVSIYRTDANGGQLYRALDAPPGLTDFLVGAGALGAQPGTQYLEPLPGGQIIAAWMGRLLVARGRTLVFSSPLRYGLYNPTQDFVVLPSRIVMVCPVNDGVFIADGKKCYLLAGTDPATWQLRALDMAPPPLGGSAVLDGSLFKDTPSVPVACWLSGKGFALGLPEGQVAFVQEKRLRLNMPGQSWLTVFNRRLFAGG